MRVFRKQHPDSTRRRIATIERLEKQLTAGTRPPKLVAYDGAGIGVSHDSTTPLPLQPTDVIRIKKELAVLKQRT